MPVHQEYILAKALVRPQQHHLASSNPIDQAFLKTRGCSSFVSAMSACPCCPHKHSSGLGSGINNGLKSALPPQACPAPLCCHCSCGLYWVNKLAQCPTLLMRTRSHDGPLPTLKLSGLRDRYHYFLFTSQWNASWSL